MRDFHYSAFCNFSHGSSVWYGEAFAQKSSNLRLTHSAISYGLHEPQLSGVESESQVRGWFLVLSNVMKWFKDLLTGLEWWLAWLSWCQEIYICLIGLVCPINLSRNYWGLISQTCRSNIFCVMLAIEIVCLSFLPRTYWMNAIYIIIILKVCNIVVINFLMDLQSLGTLAFILTFQKNWLRQRKIWSKGSNVAKFLKVYLFLVPAMEWI